jgi:hypothetical protein
MFPAHTGFLDAPRLRTNFTNFGILTPSSKKGSAELSGNVAEAGHQASKSRHVQSLHGLCKSQRTEYDEVISEHKKKITQGKPTTHSDAEANHACQLCRFS